MTLYPLKFKPILKERVWGGTKLQQCFDKTTDGYKPIGESWEISAHGSDVSIIENGPLKGTSLQELLRKHRTDILGKESLNWGERFPLLIKFIDAQEKLSVQVHPDDRYALEHENDSGKTELWYIIHATPNAKIVYGLRKNTSKYDFIDAIQDNNVEQTLREIVVKPGDVIFIPAGAVHAIGENILIAEIQENSDTTYRVYDWGRLGLDGKPRELHIQKALDVINFNEYMENPIIEGKISAEEGYRKTTYISCEYFTFETIDIEEIYKDELEDSRFEIFLCVDEDFEITYGSGLIEPLRKGQSVLIPASIGDYSIRGKGKLLRVYIE